MLLIDGDIIAYRIAWACDEESSEEYAKTSCDTFVSNMLLAYQGKAAKYQLYLTGKGNFRHEYAVTAPYKGNRKSRPPPRYLPSIREHLIKKWDAVVVEGEEADDAIAIDATLIGKDAVMASIDKDFDQIAGTHYDFIKDREYYVEPVEGLKFFYQQIITGDAIDNIIGVDGIGQQGAKDLIQGCRNELDMWDIVRDQIGDERALENARLCWLRREAGQIWEPPTTRDIKEVWYGEETSATH
tara:strand:- start:812 stop:1537 length:726 start_codon:yes stop_codon:yes gene_type:complete